MKRLDYGSDGSSLWSVITSFAPANQTAISAANQAIINGDATQTGQYLQLISLANTYSGIIIKFSKKANIEKIFLSYRWATVTGTPATTFLVEASSDSTDGNGGTWTTIFTESQTVPAANSDFRLFLKIQTAEEFASAEYTYIRISWTGNANLNNLRLMSFWVYAEYVSPPLDYFDAAGLKKFQAGEIFLGAYHGGVAISRQLRFKLKNQDSAERTYTLTFAKVKSVADAVFAAHIRLSTDGSTKATSIDLTIAASASADFYLHVDVPATGSANANPQDAQFHYGKVTISASGVTVLPAFFLAISYDTLVNIEILQGIGLTTICLVYQRDITDEREISAWAWWDVGNLAGVTPRAACVQQEAVGNDIILLLTSDGYAWELDRNEHDNEEFAPEPILMVWKTVELPAKADPHIWRRALWFDFDIDGADAGIMAEHLLTAHQDTGENVTTTVVQLANPGMRLIAQDTGGNIVGFQFNHEIRAYTGGKLAFKNWSFYYQDLTLRGRLPFVA